jgi:2-methylcitrate dehydratase PrpD
MVHVVVRLRDGTMLEETVEAPRGSERSFASSEDVIENFMKLVMWRIPSAQAAGIVEQVMALEPLGGLDDFIRLLSGRSGDPSAAG